MPDMPKFDRLVNAPSWVQNYYRIRLDVECRSVRGEGFQRLFDRLMRSIHGADYRDTVALGSHGDEGCDGYLESRRIVFACYGPDPYFRLQEATAKMRGDFHSALEHWEIPGYMQEWIFVVNYPGAHPALLREVKALSQEVTGLESRVWTRTDLVEQFLLWARRRSLIKEFGAISSHMRSAGRAYIVPESTALPRKNAEASMRLIRARLCCDASGYRSALSAWSRFIAEDPFAALVTETQVLLGAIATVAMARVLDPEKPPIARLLYESEIARSSWKKYGQRAWAITMSVIHSVDEYIDAGDDNAAPYVDPIDDDLDKLIGTIVTANKLALGLVRIYSRSTGEFETEGLDDVWEWMLKVKIYSDEEEHRKHLEEVLMSGELDDLRRER
jgi:hypothetical protein